MEHQELIDALLENLKLVAQEATPAQVQAVCADQDPFDLAAALRELSLGDIQSLMERMAPEQASEVLTHMDAPLQTTLLDNFRLDHSARLVGLMEPDDAADVVSLVPEDQSSALMEMLHPTQREPIENLLTYEEETAGRIMDPDVVTIGATQNVGEAVEQIRGYVEKVNLDRFYSAFVVSGDNYLEGMVPVWKMLLADPGTRVAELMDPVTSAIHANMDQEEAAKYVRDHDLVAAPVVDDNNRLVGRLTVDDVVDVIDEEHHEDLGHLSGTGTEEVRELSIFQTIRLRAPWLMVALVGEILLAGMMREQEDFLARLPQLAFFIPLIMAMGGNAGVQSASLVIRGLATGEVRLGHFWSRLGREILAAFTTGLLFGLILVGGGALLTGRIELGLAVGIATMTGIIVAAALGTSIPMVLKRFNMDPALATGPFITTLNDILGILLYLGIAYAILV